MNIQPIESLSPYIGGRWVIKARVTDKSPVRTWSNARSQGKLFSMTLVDQSGPIRATVFQEGVDKFYETLVEGNVYTFSKGQIKTANKKFSAVNCEYELSFDKDTEITSVRASDALNKVLPLKVFNFVPIGSLKGKEKGSTLDVIGLITAIQNPQTITTKIGQSLIKRNISLADQTAQIDVVVWDILATNWDLPVGAVIGIKSARLSEFNGELTLSLGHSSTLERSPPESHIQTLRQWFRSCDGVIQVPNLSLSDGTSSSRGPVQYRNTLEEIPRLGLGRGEKPDYIHVRATITHIKADSLMYDACPTCHKKLIPVGMETALRCEKCDKTYSVSEPRYLVALMISDGTSQNWVTVFDEHASKIFGMSAAEMKRQAMEDPNFISYVCTSRMYAQFVAAIRVKEERFGDGFEERVKLSLVNPFRWIGNLPPMIGEDGPLSTFAYELQIMLREIDLFFA